jgi:hypothetical protein
LNGIDNELGKIECMVGMSLEWILERAGGSSDVEMASGKV